MQNRWWEGFDHGLLYLLTPTPGHTCLFFFKLTAFIVIHIYHRKRNVEHVPGLYPWLYLHLEAGLSWHQVQQLHLPGATLQMPPRAHLAPARGNRSSNFSCRGRTCIYAFLQEPVQVQEQLGSMERRGEVGGPEQHATRRLGCGRCWHSFFI